MHAIGDRMLILVLCSILLVSSGITGEQQVAALLIALTALGLNGYRESTRFRLISISIYTIACLPAPYLCYFLPLIYYDALALPLLWQAIAIPLALGVTFANLPLIASLLSLSFIILTYYLSYRTNALKRAELELISLRDSSQEFSLLLRQQNKKLIEKQDYEVHLATLSERNRIAREIHDQVGHLLARSLLQIGALHATHKGPVLAQGLAGLQETLTQALDGIRSSVHDLHADSFGLETQLNQITQDFPFCELRFEYRIKNEPAADIKLCFIAISKEGLHNIMRHSNATQATLTLLEHPSLYQLILQDNGHRKEQQVGFGLGIQNMEDRVAELNGQITIDQQDGFRIFVSIPKEGANQ